MKATIYLLSTFLLLFSVTGVAGGETIEASPPGFTTISLYEEMRVDDLSSAGKCRNSITHFDGGFLFGGFIQKDDYIAPMASGDALIFFDENGHEQWKIVDNRLTGCMYTTIKKTEDALFLGTEDKQDEWGTSLMKVSMDGLIDWKYMSPESITILDFYPTDDGGLLFTGASVQQENEIETIGILTKMDALGEIEWTYTYEALALMDLYSIHPLDDGYVLAGRTDKGVHIVLHTDASGIPTGYFYVNELGDDQMRMFLRFVESSQGQVVLVAENHALNSEDRPEDEPTSSLSYSTIDAQTFAVE